MSDIITRLLLKTNDFDANLKNSKQSVNSFQGDISNMAKTAGVGIAKFAGGLGLAVGAGEMFMKTVRGSQTTSDAFDSQMRICQTSVNEFFTSLSTGDFSTFFNGLDDIAQKAMDANAALDQLGNARISYDYFKESFNADIAKGRTDALDKSLPKEKRMEGFSAWENALIDKSKKGDSVKADALDALKKILVEGNLLNADNISLKDFETVLSYDVAGSADREKLKKNMAHQYDTYRVKSEELNKRKDSGGVPDWAFPNSEGAKERRAFNDKLAQQQKELNSQFEASIIFEQMLVKWGDEKLINAVQLGKEYKQIDREASTDKHAFNKAKDRFSKEKENENKPKQEEQPRSGSLAYFNTEISKKNKELLNATTSQARTAVQVTINELEAKKLNLKIAIEKDVFSQKHFEKENKESSKIEEIESAITVYDNLILKKKKELSTEITESAHASLKAEIKELESTTTVFNDLVSNKKTQLSSETNENVRTSIQSEITKLENTVSLFENLAFTKKTALSSDTYESVRSTIESEIKTMESVALSFNDLVSNKKTQLSSETNENVRTSIQSEIKELESTTIVFNSLISKKQAELIGIASKSIQSPIQAEIQKLESTKIKLTAEITELKVTHGNGMKSGILDGYNNNHRDNKGNPLNPNQFKKVKAPKFKSPISKEDVNVNWQYAESLTEIGNAFGAMGQMAAKFGSDGMAFALNSIGSIAQMIVQLQSLATANGVASAMALPFPANLGAIATVVGTVASVFSSLPAFENGGFVPGSSFSGDNVLARVNSGEMIINKGQQGNLFKMLNGGSYSGADLGALNKGVYGGIAASMINSPGQYVPNSRNITSGESNSKVEIHGNVRVKGGDLELALKNYCHKKNKVR